MNKKDQLATRSLPRTAAPQPEAMHDRETVISVMTSPLCRAYAHGHSAFAHEALAPDISQLAAPVNITVLFL